MIETLTDNNLRLRAVTVFAAGIALAGCTASESNNDRAINPPPVVTQSPQASPIEAGESCLALSVPVYPGSRLKTENSSSIDKQLTALKIAKTPGAELNARTIFNAQAIIANSLVDNEYAAAFDATSHNDTDDFPNADQLIADSNLNATTGACLTRKQLQQVRNVAGILVGGLGPQTGKQLSAGAKVAYQSLRNSYDSFLERYRDELA